MKKLLFVVALGALAVGGYSYANYYVSKEARKDVDKQLLQFHAQTGVDVRYDELTTDLFNQSISLGSVTVNDPEGNHIADVASIEMQGFNPEKVSDYSRFAINDLTFKGAALEGMKELDGEKIDLVTEFKYSESNGDADAKTVINAGKIANIKFDFAMTNSQQLMALSEQLNKMAQQADNGQANLQQQLALQSQLMTAMTTIVPKSMSFELNNNGKLKGILERLVAEQGMTFEQFQMQAQQQLSMSPAPARLRDAALGFIDGTEQFKVSVSLPEGTSVAQINQKMMTMMGDPEELANYFNLEASGN